MSTENPFNNPPQETPKPEGGETRTTNKGTKPRRTELIRRARRAV